MAYARRWREKYRRQLASARKPTSPPQETERYQASVLRPGPPTVHQRPQKKVSGDRPRPSS
ncbi:hypothetical protein RE6C_05006 [Rhodopirellula europaea 6C]|uniref:Uncharacterized protein n=1 Tax=Rhodopirellula europaea 6C TaxID=1263867 RepID=M2AX98_9BACT|nr:hypothetical protein RE6C_05006 [Rhodopirellula europaea 6C]